MERSADLHGDSHTIETLRQQLARRERELQELNHRIANSLQVAAGFLAFQSKGTTNAETRAALGDAATRLEAVGKLHRYLYAHSQDAEVDLAAFLNGLCPDIAQSTGLGCSVESDPVMLPGETAQQLAIVINELALNARKHGYDDGQDGVLHVESRVSAGLLRLTVSDGGRGLSDDFDVDGERGLGMTVIRNIAKQLGGTLRAEDAQGARFTLTAPLRHDASVPTVFSSQDGGSA
jgi:two-component sensor histidine kinase